MKFKLTKKRIAFLFIFFLIGLSLFVYFNKLSPIYSLNYHGEILSFRANLREANKMPVYPDESLIHQLLRSQENVTIVFMNTSDLGYVGIQAFEIAYKLKIASIKLNLPLEISAKEVESFDNLPKSSVFIALVPPSISNETLIKVKDNIIFIKAENPKDFDLATAKFLIIALRIKV